jgi:hypothetical protein
MHRTRSCTINSQAGKRKSDLIHNQFIHLEKEEETELLPKVQDTITPPLSPNKRRRIDDNIFEAMVVSPLEKRELHTRNGRRVRCNGFIWKHLCADKKDTFYKRKYQRQTLPMEKFDQIIETDQTPSLPSDPIDSSLQISPITQMKNSKKRKTTSGINNGEHMVPKRKTKGQKRIGNT